MQFVRWHRVDRIADQGASEPLKIGDRLVECLYLFF
jgi:hypothetical protein